MSRAAVLERLRPRSAADGYRELQALGVAAIKMGDGRERYWAHAGLLYSWRKQVRLFELKTHRDIDDTPARPGFVWVEPSIPRERAQLLVGRCRLLHQLRDKKIVPYGFRYGEGSFDAQGDLHLASDEIGVTCSTIINAVFESERIRLVDASTWPPADGDDQATRRPVIEFIRKGDPTHPPDPEHAARLDQEITAPRIRPEEVVAAAAMHPTIATFETVVEGAAVVTQRIGL